MLLLAKDADTGEQFTDVQVRDEVITMLAAGTDTTANTVSWVLHVLGGRPDLRARVHAEVDAVVGDRPVTLADVPQLEMIRRMISESLRLYPQAWMLMRMTTVPVRLGETELPAGAPLLLPLYAMHRDPAVYPGPHRLRPGPVGRRPHHRRHEAVVPALRRRPAPVHRRGVRLDRGRHRAGGGGPGLAPATGAGPYGGDQLTVHIEADPAADDAVPARVRAKFRRASEPGRSLSLRYCRTNRPGSCSCSSWTCGHSRGSRTVRWPPSADRQAST